jgi:hypothetical protein
MRLQVKFRFRADTGEVEVFEVTTVDDGPRDPRHDALHEEAARNLARVVDPHARVIEEVPSAAPAADTGRERSRGVPGEAAEHREQRREEPLR